MTQQVINDERAESAVFARIRPAEWAVCLVRSMAVQDWLILTYFAIVLMALAFGSGPHRDESIRMVGIDVAFVVAGLLLSRGEIIQRHTFWNSFVYRMTIFGAVFLSYFQLREILPGVSSRALDAEIYAFDLKAFGVEPALAWDRFVTPQTTEWFAFFYFSYFFILTIHIVPFLLFVRNARLLDEFALGVFVVFCTAHTVYMLVPGFGPYAYLESAFNHRLEGGLFWKLVVDTVNAGGAQKDIFPSLHTAAPTFFAIYSFRHRNVMPFKYTWPIVGFFAIQIIGATMFLRWHYLIDICAGLTLASAANWIAWAVTRWERPRRERMGVQRTFFPLADALRARRARGANPDY